MKLTALLGAALLGLATAACPNKCSGHGACGASDLCSCQQRWTGFDCSERQCPYGLSWTMAGDGVTPAGKGLGGHHKYAECSSKGACDRATGECKCYDGYAGRGCRRNACPKGCAGHGRCLYASEADATYTSDLSATFASQFWDAGKTRQCACDRGWEGYDCSSRICPKGDDPLTSCDTSAAASADAKAHEQIQRVVVQLKPTEAETVVKLSFTGVKATLTTASTFHGDASTGTGGEGVIIAGVSGSMCGAPVVQYRCSGAYGKETPFACVGTETVLARGKLLCSPGAGTRGNYVGQSQGHGSGALAAVYYVNEVTGTFAICTDVANQDHCLAGGSGVQVRASVRKGTDPTALVDAGGSGVILGRDTGHASDKDKFPSKLTAAVTASASTGCNSDAVALTGGYPAQFQYGLCDAAGYVASGKRLPTAAGLLRHYWGYISLKYTDMFGGEYFTRPILIDASAAATQTFPQDVTGTPTAAGLVAMTYGAGSAHREWQWESTKALKADAASGNILAKGATASIAYSGTVPCWALFGGKVVSRTYSMYTGTANADAGVAACGGAGAPSDAANKVITAGPHTISSGFNPGYGYTSAPTATMNANCMTAVTTPLFTTTIDSDGKVNAIVVTNVGATVTGAAAFAEGHDGTPATMCPSGGSKTATGAIVLDFSAPTGTAATVLQGLGAAVGKRTSTMRYTADRIRAALQDLPNFAIPSVNVTNAFLDHPAGPINTVTTDLYKARIGSAYAGSGRAMFGNVFDVTFSDAATTGAQPLLECYYNTKRAAAGAFPRMNNVAATTTNVDDCWVEVVSDPAGQKSYEETTECSNRGSCDGATGVCKCFEGHTGEACATQNIFF